MASEVVIVGPKGDHIFDQIRSSKTFYEADLLEFAALLLNRRLGFIVDVGANIGNHTVFFGKVLQRNVVAVEPNPQALRLLKTNIAHNGLSNTVTVVEAGASDAKGKGRVNTSIEGSLSLGMSSVVETSTAGEDTIALTTLDEIIQGLPTSWPREISLIKIDVEGFEERVLLGALQSLAAHRPLLIVEAATEDHLQKIENVLRPFAYVRCGPFSATPTYVFGSSKITLWRALMLRRILRNWRRLKRRINR